MKNFLTVGIALLVFAVGSAFGQCSNGSCSSGCPTSPTVALTAAEKAAGVLVTICGEKIAPKYTNAAGVTVYCDYCEVPEKKSTAPALATFAAAHGIKGTLQDVPPTVVTAYNAFVAAQSTLDTDTATNATNQAALTAATTAAAASATAVATDTTAVNTAVQNLIAALQAAYPTTVQAPKK